MATEHLNARNELRSSVLLRFLQEVAGEQVTELGWGREVLLKKNIIWVIGKTHVEIARLPVFGEDIDVKTWPNKTKLFLYPRSVEALTPEGETLFKASTIWTLVDFSSRKFADTSALGMDLGYLETGTEVSCPSTLRFPDLDQKATLTPGFRDIDVNGHVNNTIYLDLVEDLIPHDFILSHSPKTIDIQYKKEIRLGESVEVRYGFIDGAYCFESDRFLCKIQYL